MKSVQQPASVAAAHAELAAEQEGPVALLKAFLRMNANGSEAGSSALTSAGKSEQVLDAYGEYCQRRDAGEPLNPDEYLANYPHLRSRLARLLSAHVLLEKNPHLLDPQASVKWPLAGERFLGFQLHRELGRGAFARVFLATEPALGNRPVAVKVSLGGGAEAETLGRLGGHPNIVPVYSAPEDSATGLTAVCMPYLGSATLEDLLDRLKALAALPRGADIITHAVADQFPPGAKHPESPG